LSRFQRAILSEIAKIDFLGYPASTGILVAAEARMGMTGIEPSLFIEYRKARQQITTQLRLSSETIWNWMNGRRKARATLSKRNTAALNQNQYF
jgi:hypothetical protein